MPAIERYTSAKLVLRLDAGDNGGKKVTKRVTIGGIREGAPADALWETAMAVGALLGHPVIAVELHMVSTIEPYNDSRNGERTKNSEEAQKSSAGKGAERSGIHASHQLIPGIQGYRAFLLFAGFTGDASRRVLSWQSPVLSYANRGTKTAGHGTKAINPAGAVP